MAPHNYFGLVKAFSPASHPKQLDKKSNGGMTNTVINTSLNLESMIESAINEYYFVFSSAADAHYPPLSCVQRGGTGSSF